MRFVIRDPKKGKVGSGQIKRMEGRTRYGRKGVKAKGRWERKVRFERKAEFRD
ncbi:MULTISPECIES: hypothetical protein [Enterobacteriaceae]|uniref:hypothetical protein n=1 Tax=Enterobacteriaceae TaxID=543 RepID=UPI00158A27DC|nr:MULTISPECIES: hypothetical protein [Enterobacteriaceae]MCW4948592.1 hypothetical protein [Enterobacter hormaechei subsp. xiangfangensis]